MTKKSVLGALLGAALTLTLLPPVADGASAAAEADVVKIRVMSYNVRHTQDTAGANYPYAPQFWSNRLPYLVAGITARNPAIVGLQEVNAAQDGNRADDNDLTMKAALAPTHEPVLNSAGDPYDRNPIYLASGQFNVLQSGQSLYTHTGLGLTSACLAELSDRKKNFVWARVQHIATGRRYLVVNTHLVAKPCRDTNMGDVRSAEISQLRSRVKNLIETNDWQTPVIVMGDFNAKPGSRHINEMEAAWKPGAAKPLTVKRGNDDTPTHVPGADWVSGTPTTATAALDHIFWQSSRLTRVNFGVDQSVLPDLPIPPSDHYPVWATLRVD